jgi:hypothetical protein
MCGTISRQAKEKVHFTLMLLVAELIDLLSCKKSQTSVGLLPLNLMKLFLCKERLTTELAVLFKRVLQCLRTSNIYMIVFDIGSDGSWTEVFTVLQTIIITR